MPVIKALFNIISVSSVNILRQILIVDDSSLVISALFCGVCEPNGCSLYCPIYRRNLLRFWWGDLREGDHLGYPDVNGRIIYRWIFRT